MLPGFQTDIDGLGVAFDGVVGVAGLVIVESLAEKKTSSLEIRAVALEVLGRLVTQCRGLSIINFLVKSSFGVNYKVVSRIQKKVSPN